MELAALGSLLGGVGQLAGGAAGLFGGGGGQRQDQSFFHNQFVAQMDWNKELARNGIQMRVADAKAAGLHPLYALGAPTFNPSSISIGQAGDGGVSGPDAGAALSRMGQGVERAAGAFKSKEDRALNALQQSQLEVNTLNKEKIGAEIEFIRAQTASTIARTSQAGTGPGVTTSQQFGTYEPKAPEIPNTRPGQPHAEAGPDAPANRYTRFPGGFHTALPAKDLNIDEASSPGWGTFMYTNRLLPFWDEKAHAEARPPQAPAPGFRWRITPFGWKQYPNSISDSEIERSIHGPYREPDWRRARRQASWRIE